MRMVAKLALMVLAVGLAALLLVTLAQVSPSAGDVLYGKPLRLKLVAILRIRYSRFKSLFYRMSLSQNRCTLLRDML